MPHTDLSSPPRRTGDDKSDLAAIIEWLGADLFAAIVKEARLLDPIFAPLAIVEISIADDETEASYTFATPRSDTNYKVLVQAKSVVDSGTLLGSAAFVVRSITRTAAGFTVAFCADPGTDNAITFDAFLFAT